MVEIALSTHWGTPTKNHSHLVCHHLTDLFLRKVVPHHSKSVHPLWVWISRASFWLELRHTRLKLCRETVTNSPGIVGCLTATKKTPPTSSHEERYRKGKLKKMPIPQQELFERKSGAFLLHSDKVALYSLAILLQTLRLKPELHLNMAVNPWRRTHSFIITVDLSHADWFSVMDGKDASP